MLKPIIEDVRFRRWWSSPKWTRQPSSPGRQEGGKGKFFEFKFVNEANRDGSAVKFNLSESLKATQYQAFKAKVIDLGGTPQRRRRLLYYYHRSGHKTRETQIS